MARGPGHPTMADPVGAAGATCLQFPGRAAPAAGSQLTHLYEDSSRVFTKLRTLDFLCVCVCVCMRVRMCAYLSTGEG